MCCSHMRRDCRAEVRGETARVGGVRVVCRGSGSYFAAFYKGEDSELIAQHVVAVLWPGIAAGT